MSNYERGVIVVAAARIVGGLALGATAPSGKLWPAQALAALDFAIVGGALLAGGRRDVRAGSLGTAFLLVASVFAAAVGAGAVRHLDGPVAVVAGLLLAANVDAFVPFWVWRFAAEFPRLAPEQVRPRERRRFAAVVRACFAVGAALVAANLALHTATVARLPSLGAALRPLSFYRTGFHWVAQFTLSAAALVTIVRRSRRASPAERRRVALLAWGLAAGSAPMLAWLVTANVYPPFARWLPAARASWVLFPALLTVPVTTAYAVLVHRALDVRLVVRRALQYALARSGALALVAAPILALFALAYQRRNASIAALVASPEGLGLLAAAAAGALVVRGRRGLLDRIDRRFFRQQYDARVILAGLVDGCRAAVTRGELAHALRTEIDRALQVESCVVLLLDPAAGALVAPDGGVRPLGARTALARALAAGGPLDVTEDGAVAGGAAGPNDTPALLPDERYWLVDGGFRLLLALRAPDRSLAGVIALGARKSELPFSAEDRLLLGAVAAAAELSLAARASPEPTADASGPDASVVAECVDCGALAHDAPGDDLTRRCPACGGPLGVCALPRRLGGKFRVERRVGAGGMGVVYRATDLHLGRPVALKTLPHVGADSALRLRREARAMAVLTHPNLAAIHGTESWYGRPVLVCEYVAGGTLADRLRDGPLPEDDVIALGLTLARALAAVHAAGVLHRDVKPSNIGFAEDGQPKLLDFGLARVLDAARAPAVGTALDTLGNSRDTRRAGNPRALASRSVGASVGDSVLWGTPAYMPPSALAGETPDAAFDLWALGVVMFEAATGDHPFAGRDGGVDYRRVLTGAATDPRALRPSLSVAFAAVLTTALARDPGARYPSASAFAAALAELR